MFYDILRLNVFVSGFLGDEREGLVREVGFLCGISVMILIWRDCKVLDF